MIDHQFQDGRGYRTEAELKALKKIDSYFKLCYLFAKKGNFFDTSILAEVQQDSRCWILDAGQQLYSIRLFFS